MQIIDTIKMWADKKKEMHKYYLVNDELSATRRLFEVDIIDSLFCGVIYHNSNMIGYQINERVGSQYAISHFAKSLIQYKGVTEALMQKCSKVLDEIHVQYLNIESDLDDLELRKSKISWHPIKKLKRYSISKK